MRLLIDLKFKQTYEAWGTDSNDFNRARLSCLWGEIHTQNLPDMKELQHTVHS
jgi:hypothetical protein